MQLDVRRVVGVGSASAMMTLRERKTQYGIIVNLPDDHTADTINPAAIAAFTTMPAHLKRTLTWDSRAWRWRDTASSPTRLAIFGAVQPVAARRERELQRPGPAILPTCMGSAVS